MCELERRMRNVQTGVELEGMGWLLEGIWR